MSLHTEKEFEKEPFEGGYDENGNEVKAELGMEEEYVKASDITVAELQTNLTKNLIQIIEIAAGCSLEQVFDEFQQRKKDGRVYVAEFNGKTINSNMSLDEIYMAVNGLNKDDFDIETAIEQYEKERDLANSKIVNLFVIQKYLNYDLTDEQQVIFREMYPKISDSVESIYGGKDVVFVLKMLIALKNHDLTYIEEQIEKENFSGSVYHHVMNTLSAFGVEIPPPF